MGIVAKVIDLNRYRIHKERKEAAKKMEDSLKRDGIDLDLLNLQNLDKKWPGRGDDGSKKSN